MIQNVFRCDVDKGWIVINNPDMSTSSEYQEYTLECICVECSSMALGNMYYGPWTMVPVFCSSATINQIALLFQSLLLGGFFFGAC